MAVQSQSGPRCLGEWLHIAQDGRVTAFTGKVEVGQGSRTSLSRIVADELRVPIDTVRLVMGDTGATPYDAGTFGSRTTATMGPQLRAVAAIAREALIRRAAGRWQVDPATVAAEQGAVRHSPSGRTLTYGSLADADLFAIPIDDDAATTTRGPWNLSAVVPPKIDGRAIVTGEHRYTPDLSRPGMLHGKVLRPPRLNATLLRVDDAAARRLPGVTVVRDGAFVGVVAPSAGVAARGLASLRAEWQYPDADTVDSSTIADYLRSHPDEPTPNGRPSAQTYEAGNVEQAWTEAALGCAATYTTAFIAHAPLEPRAALAVWDGDSVTVWTGTQRPFGVRGQLAADLGVPEARVRVIVPDTGSAYGGKHTGEAALEAARLARAVGSPVKVVWTREEEFSHAYFRPAAVIDVRSAVATDGQLLGWEMHNYNAGPGAIRTPYDAPNQRIAYHPVRSPLRQGSYRALAATANIFARETNMDELAHALKQDPLAFRLHNLSDARLRAVLTAATECFGWTRQQAGRPHGIGLACGTEKGGYVACCAEVIADRTSGAVRVLRVVEAYECGTIVHAANLRHQIEGAVVQGLGGALFERIEFAEGRVLNPRFSRYRVPRFADLPVIETVLLDRPDLPPAGAGETPIVAIAPAIGNAIFAATGIRLRSLPLLPAGVLA